MTHRDRMRISRIRVVTPIAGARPAGQTRQRSTPLAVFGVLCCFLGALTFGALHLRLDQRTPALVVARPIAVGQVVQSDDLRVARVSATGIDLIKSAERSSVI